MLIVKKHAGISLVEMAITLVVLSIILAMATPGFRDWIQNTRIRTAAEGAQSGLQLARAEAVWRNAKVEFVLNNDLKSGWTVRTAAPISDIQSRPAGEGSAGVTLTTDPAGALTVTFDGLGRALPANGDGSARLEQIDIAGQSAGRNLRVLVGLGGQIRLCDPAVVDSTDPRRC